MQHRAQSMGMAATWLWAGAVPGVGASPTPCPDQSHLDFMSRGTGDGWLWRLLLFQERSMGSGEFSVGKTTAMQSTG